MSEEGEIQKQEIKQNQLYDFVLSPGWKHVRTIFLNKIVEFGSNDIIDMKKDNIEVQVIAAKHVKAALQDILAEVEGVKDTKKYDQEVITKQFEHETYILNLGDEDS